MIDRIQKVVRVDVIGESQRRQILPFVGLVHPVDDQNVVKAELVQPPNHRTPNKPGSAGDYDFFTCHLGIIPVSGIVGEVPCRGESYYNRSNC